jgi:hypothetical protein
MRVTLALAVAWVTLMQPPRPLDIVLMVDVSHSVTHAGFFKTDRGLVLDAATTMASVLTPADRVRLGSFGQTITVTPALDIDAAQIVRAAGTLGTVGGPSPLWDALDAAADALTPSGHRQAIVVITDGRSTGNRLGFQDVLQHLERTGVRVCVVALDVTRRPGPDPAVRLRQIAERTGGTYTLVKRGNLRSAIRRVVPALR